MGKNGYSIVLAFILMIGGLAGCGQKMEETYSKEKTNYYTTALDGEKHYYTDNQKDVKQIKQLSVQFIEALNEVDYNRPEVEKAYNYYTKEVRREYKEKGILENSKKNLRERQLQMKVDDIVVNQLEFYTIEGKRTCNTIVDFNLIIDHATEKYIQQRKLVIGQPKRWKYIITFVLEDEEWKIENYVITEVEQVE